MPKPALFEQILGVRFYNGNVESAVDYLQAHGGYVVVPAAPALANITCDKFYRTALLEADLAIADSGFMVLLWRGLHGRKVTRISGLKYAQQLLRQPISDRRIFLVLPTSVARDKALAFLSSRNFEITKAECYVAPIYENVVADKDLIELLNLKRPAEIVVGLGGGAQEKLGLYLREHLAYRPAIHCIGAALGFLTGEQKPIPSWADRLYLGWLLRLARHPQLYARRFSRAFALPGLILRYGHSAPPLH